MQDQLAAARHQQGQDAAKAQEVTRLQRQVADLHAESANQADEERENRVELMQQLDAAQAGMESSMPQAITSYTDAEGALQSYSAMHVPRLHGLPTRQPMRPWSCRETALGHRASVCGSKRKCCSPASGWAGQCSCSRRDQVGEAGSGIGCSQG